MRKFPHLLCLLVFFYFPNLLAAQDFRSASFGSSVAEVKATESSVEWLDIGGGIHGFLTDLASLDTLVWYVFVQDKFVRGVYVIQEPHANNTTYVDDYKKLAGFLETKYGRPYEDETLWMDDLYKDRPSQWGTAIGTGRLAMFKKWQTESTDIILMITGDNFKVDLKLEYNSREYSSLEDEVREKEALSDF